MNEYGHYAAVDVLQKDDNETGGVVQLKHGQQRLIVARVTSVPNTGNLPFSVHSIIGVSVGNVTGRSKLQRPLSSYQDDGLSR